MTTLRSLAFLWLLIDAAVRDLAIGVTRTSLGTFGVPADLSTRHQCVLQAVQPNRNLNLDQRRMHGQSSDPINTDFH